MLLANRSFLLAHEFRLNQLVRFSSATHLSQLSTDGVYEIIRLMPEDRAGDVSYRLKSPAGERVARESELVDAEAVPAA